MCIFMQRNIQNIKLGLILMNTKKRYLALFSALIMLTGCAGDTTSTVSGDQTTATTLHSVKEPGFIQTEAFSAVDIVDVPSVIVEGKFGQESDKLIPSVFLTVEDQSKISRTTYSPCTIQIDASMAKGYESTEVLTAQIKGRGHSTWEWAKKPYKIKLTERANILGMKSAKEWVLISNYSDESLIRNTVAYAMADSMYTFRYTAHAIPVDLYVNGIYQGVYTIGEQLEVKENRIEIDDNIEDSNTGYLLEIGGADPEEDVKGVNCFDLPSGCATDIIIKSPNTEKWTQAHYDYIYDYMCKADEAIVNLDGYENYIDVASFIDWFLLHELTYNLDSCFRRSCYITKTKDGKLEMGPVWDFDLAFGNFYQDNVDYDDWATYGSSNSNSYIHINWFNYLMQDERFVKKARSRWDAIKDKLMETAMQSIDENSANIAPSAKVNFEVWDTLEITNGYQPSTMKSLSTYNEQVQYIRRFLQNRYDWIDENL